MIKKFVFFFFILFISTITLAQKEIFSLPILHTNSVHLKVTDENSVSNKRIFSLFFEKDSIYRFIFNKNVLEKYIVFNITDVPQTECKALEISLENFLMLKNKYIDAYVFNDVQYEICKGKNNLIYSINTNLITKVTTSNVLFNLEKEENTITNFYNKGNYYFITFIKGKNDIKIYTIDSNQKLTIKTTTIIDKRIFSPNNNFFSQKESAGDYFKKLKSIKIYNNKDYPLKYFENNKTMYLMDSTIVLGYKSTPTKNLQFNINYINATNYFDSTIAELPLDAKKRNFNKEYASSVLVDSFLIKILIDKNFKENKIILRIFNRNKENLVKEITFSENDEFPLVFNKFQWNKYNEEKVKKVSVSKFLDLLKKEVEPIKIKATNNDSILQITFGIMTDKVTVESIAASILISGLGTYIINSVPGYMGYMLMIIGSKDAIENSATINYNYKNDKVEIDNLTNKTIDKVISSLKKINFHSNKFNGFKFEDEFILSVINDKENKIQFYSIN